MLTNAGEITGTIRKRSGKRNGRKQGALSGNSVDSIIKESIFNGKEIEVSIEQKSAMGSVRATMSPSTTHDEAVESVQAKAKDSSDHEGK